MAPPADGRKSGLSNLQIRLISAAVLLPVVTAAIYLGHPYFTLLIALFGGAAAWEWVRIAATVKAAGRIDPVPTAPVSRWGWRAAIAVTATILAVLMAGFGGGATYAIYVIGIFLVATAVSGLIGQRRLARWNFVGILYIAVPSVALVLVRNEPVLGQAALFWIIALVVAADTGGYIAGRSIGGPKLAPRISPNKTWAGLAGAVVGAALVGLFTAFILNHTNVWVLALLSAALGVVEQAGDLVESAFKRHFGVKDASHIIPGHGGVLDRVDGLLAVALAVLVISEWTGRSILVWS